MSIRAAVLAGLIPVAFLFSQGCGNSDATDGTGSDIATAAMAGSANSSEGSLAMKNVGERQSLWAKLDRAFSIPDAFAAAACISRTGSGTCTSGSSTLVFGTPTVPCALVGGLISFYGDETFTWNSTAACATNSLGGASGNSYVRRTYDGATTAAPLVRTVGLYTVTMNTEDTSGWSAPITGGATGGFAVTCTGTTCATGRSIAINYAHYTSSLSATAVWDHTVDTLTANGGAPIVIAGSGVSRIIQSGAIHIQHNVAKIESVTTINGPLTSSATCCFPISGSVTTKIKGGKLDGKSETLTYTSTCGTASLSNSAGKTSDYTLRHCL